MAKFVISMEEAIVAVRNQYGLPESVEIEINKDCSIEQDDFAWQNVPSNWNSCHPPAGALKYSRIEVIRRDGFRQFGKPTDWSEGWIQENCECDIVKFRKANDY